MLDVENLSLGFTGDFLFENVNLKINKGDRIGLVGANGAGKTTFLKLILGIEKPEAGTIRKQKGVKIGYLPQEIISLKGKSLFKEVKSSLQIVRKIEREEDEIHRIISAGGDLEKDNSLKERFELLNHLKEQRNYYSIDSRIEKVLQGLGFTEEDFNKPVGDFSGGWQMRIELSKILLEDNDILLMDEPTNHLDIDSLEWLIKFLKSFKGALLLVSHDKNFLLEVTDKTLEIFNRKVTFFKGNYEEYLKFKEARRTALETQRKNLEQKKKEAERFVERFRYKATKARQAQSRLKALEKMDIPEVEGNEKSIDVTFPSPPRSGAIVVELENIRKSFGNNLVFDSVNLKIERGEKIALLGPNGAGKSTLSKIISRRLEPDSGKIKFGHNVIINYYSQDVADNLDMSKSVLETMASAGSDLTEGRLRTILGAFLFSGDDVYKKVKVLSGGEKSRLALAKLLLTQSNLIVLDEPTNHLDFNSKEALKKALLNYSGSLVVVTHDVDFLRSLATKIVDIREKKIKLFYGDIDYYISKKFEVNTSSKRKTDAKNISSKKEQKRIEAELRTKKYRETKGLKEKIARLEEKIEMLEEGKSQLEKELGQEEVFANPELSKRKNAEYQTTIKELETAYEEWTTANEELENIERNFETNFLH